MKRRNAGWGDFPGFDDQLVNFIITMTHHQKLMEHIGNIWGTYGEHIGNTGKYRENLAEYGGFLSHGGTQIAGWFC